MPQLSPGARAKKAILEFWKTTADVRTKRRQMQIAALLRKKAPLFAKASRAILKNLRSAVLPKLSGFKPPKDAKYSEILAQAGRIIDWAAWEKQSSGMFERLMSETFRASAATVVIKGRTDPIGVAGKKWATKNSAKLVKDISLSTRKVIARTIRTGYDKGEAIQAIGRRLRPMIGLTEKQAERAGARYSELLVDLSEEDALKGMTRFADSMIRGRAEMIARTETAAAASEGTLESYSENDISMVDWVADPTACEACQEMEANGPYPIEEARERLPLHPNCECTWVMALEV